MGRQYGRVLFLKDYASYIKDSMILELTDLNRRMMLSIDMIPVPTDEAVREVENKLLGVETNVTNWQRRQNSNQNFSAVVPYDLEQQRKVPAEAYHMGKWLGYTVELCFDGQWFNIDQWHRSASGKLKHRYLHTAPERDILSSPYDELALLKKWIRFSDLAASTQDIICAENPAFERSSFGAWDFFIWGSLADLEALLQKPVKNEDDKCISKTLLKELVFKIQDQISFFQQTIPHWINNWSPETSVRIIICEL